MPKDHKKAVALLAKGCVAADYQVWTCNAFAKVVASKDGVAVKIAEDWKKACAAKDTQTCSGLERIAPKK